MIEIKLPPAKSVNQSAEHYYQEVDFCLGYNNCLMDVKSLNPSGWEVDEKVLGYLIAGQTGLNNKECQRISKELSEVSTKWLKPVQP